jgi:hypothetical protein
MHLLEIFLSISNVALYSPIHKEVLHTYGGQAAMSWGTSYVPPVKEKIDELINLVISTR